MLDVRAIPKETATSATEVITDAPAGQYAADSRTEAANRLREGLLTCAPAIDIADCRLPAAEVGALYAAVLYDDPALFHVAPRLSYATASFTTSSTGNSFTNNGNSNSAITIVTTLYPTYTLTGTALTEARTLYRDTLTEILCNMEIAFSGYPACEAAIALYLHDALADRYAYDTRAAEAASAGGDSPPNADAYRLFRDGVGICQAYALAYMALCRAAGLEACFVSSPSMNHAWNHVRLDGVWYHVDVTKDDPITAPGEEVVTHTRLLRSDAGMLSMGYEGFSCPAGHTCTDRRYEVTDTSEGAHAEDGFDVPLGVFEETLTSVFTGQSLIFVANLHGGATVAPRLRSGEFCGKNASFAKNTPDADRSAAMSVPTLRDESTSVSAPPFPAADTGSTSVAAVYLSTDGVTVTAPGDLDGDGRLTPGDLLLIYDSTLPEAWRQSMREAVVRAANSSTDAY